ncbi:TIR-like protein FxsC [Streptomyces sp. NPDC050504]|uniref:TIR-like protein FxsC n=1 Tax=Streptomyces sp. NPDC050504 TaxID=3365618 RepID=UPI0037974CB3
MADFVTSGGDRNPYFFLSYAHTPRNDPGDADPNAWVKKLYTDLCADILQMTTLPPGVQAGFMDQGMHVGEKWPDRLSEMLARCKVFIPLYSPRYFESEQCGREWWVFSQRQADQQVRSYGRSPGAIIPALWVPVAPAELPQPAKDLQFQHEEFGRDYADEGFYGLIKLSYFQKEYEKAVYQLAKRIVRVARESALEESEPLRQYESLPSSFGGHSRQFDVTVLACSRADLPKDRSADCYGQLPQDWNPYHPHSTRPLSEHAASLVGNLNYQVHVGDFEWDAERMLEAGPPRAPGLLLLDRWALDSPQRREILHRLCSRKRPWISVMVPWNADDPVPPGREAELRSLTESLLAPRTAEGSGHRSVNGGIPNLPAFGTELPAAVRQAADYYAAHAKTYPPEGEPSARPRVRGPEDLGRRVDERD